MTTAPFCSLQACRFPPVHSAALKKRGGERRFAREKKSCSKKINRPQDEPCGRLSFTLPEITRTGSGPPRAVLVNLEVEVVAERVARVADVADDVALIDPLAFIGSDGAHVRVQRGVRGVVVDRNVVAPRIAPGVVVVRDHDRTGAGSDDRGALRRADVQALVAVVAEVLRDGAVAVAGKRPAEAFARVIARGGGVRHRRGRRSRLHGRHRGGRRRGLRLRNRRRGRRRKRVAVLVVFGLRYRGRRRGGLYFWHRRRGRRRLYLRHRRGRRGGPRRVGGLLLLHLRDQHGHFICQRVFFRFCALNLLGGLALFGADLLEQRAVLLLQLGQLRLAGFQQLLLIGQRRLFLLELLALRGGLLHIGGNLVDQYLVVARDAGNHLHAHGEIVQALRVEQDLQRAHRAAGGVQRAKALLQKLHRVGDLGLGGSEALLQRGDAVVQRIDILRRGADLRADGVDLLRKQCLLGLLVALVLFQSGKLAFQIGLLFGKGVLLGFDLLHGLRGNGQRRRGEQQGRERQRGQAGEALVKMLHGQTFLSAGFLKIGVKMRTYNSVSEPVP